MKALNFPSNNNAASLVLRILLGGMFLLHGIGKAFIVGMDEIALEFIAKDFPVWTAYVSTVIEIVGGMMLLIGFYSRIASLALIPISLGILFYHYPNGWVFHNIGGGWEYPQLILISLVTVFFLGTGKYGIIKSKE